MNDAGRIGFVTSGEYNNTQTYDFLDVVYYGNSSYVAKKLTVGNPPADNNEYWQALAKVPGSTVLGVKGNAESTYRTGNVNITAANIGALAADGNAVSATKATQDGNGNVITSTYLPLSGGTITGNLRLKGSGNYGNKLNFGDGDYVYLYEDADDRRTIKGDKGINLSTGSNHDVCVNGRALSIGSYQRINTLFSGVMTTGTRIYFVDTPYEIDYMPNRSYILLRVIVARGVDRNDGFVKDICLNRATSENPNECGGGDYFDLAHIYYFNDDGSRDTSSGYIEISYNPNSCSGGVNGAILINMSHSTSLKLLKVDVLY